MKLQLTRPIVFFDVETTGNRPSEDRIIQLAAIKFWPDDSPLLSRWQGRFNPGYPVHPEATKIHGLINDDLKDEPAFLTRASNLATWFEGCDVGGYNVAFDLEVLTCECARSGVPFSADGRAIVDPLALWRALEPRTLADAVRHWCGRDMRDGAHDALVDIEETIEVLDEQIGTAALTPTVAALYETAFPPVEGAVDRAGRLLKDAAGATVLNFGKHKGLTLAAAPRRYLVWLVNESTMAGDVKAPIRAFLTEARR